MARMTDAYARRKRWEARLLAVEIWNLLGEAMDNGKKTKKPTERVSAQSFLAMFGQSV
jgi:hypothetical protein